MSNLPWPVITVITTFVAFSFGIFIGRVTQMLWDSEHPQEFLQMLGFNEQQCRVILAFRKGDTNA